MDVVGHDDVGVEAVAGWLSVAGVEDFGHDLPDGGLAKWATAVAGVEVALGSGGEEAVVFAGGGFVVGVGMVLEPLFAFGLPSGEDFLGDGVVESEGDEIDASRLSPVWEVAAPCASGGLFVVEPSVVAAVACAEGGPRVVLMFGVHGVGL